MFKTEPEAGLNGRSLDYPRGKVIGGSSAINAMIYMRGQAADYDHWRQLGLTGWGWDDVLPLFKRHENQFLGASEVHAVGGEWRVEPPRVRWEVLEAFREAAAQAGVKPIPDFNTGDNEGSCYFHVNQKRGRRWSAARGFFKPVLSRPNLRLETGCLAERILFDGRRAVAVQWRQHGATRQAAGVKSFSRRQHRIAASAALVGRRPGGAIAPARHRRGARPARRRGKFAGPSAAARHLQGHGCQDAQRDLSFAVRAARHGAAIALLRRGPLTMAPSQLGLFTRSDPSRERANIQFHVQPLSLDRFGEPLHRFPAFTASVCNVRPESRGQLRLRSPDPAVAPAIKPNYLATDEDRRVAADSLRAVRRIVAQPALARFHPQEFLPGSGVGDDEAGLIKAAGDVGTKIFHPVGTAKMGRDTDPFAVVDDRLRVIGLDGLRVIDASVMPAITSGNTAAPTMMIAEKGAAMVVEDGRVG